jgi:hypothetical protein
MCHYADYVSDHELPVAFDDLNKVDLAQWGVTEDEATRLLHVQHGGALFIGFEAFLVLWEQMPRYRILARLGRLPMIYQVCAWGYANVVARTIYLRHKRRQRRKSGNA